MPGFLMEATGRVDERDSAFPQCLRLKNGDVFCGFSVGGGQFVHGGTDWARSGDGGVTWQPGGTVVPPTTDPISANSLRFSRSRDGKTIFGYGLRYWGDPNDRFGERFGEPIFCASVDEGETWSEPRVMPLADCSLEVSHSIFETPDGALLAPAAELADPDRLGEEMFVGLSFDGGETWPERATVFKDPDGRCGYWEHKLAQVAPETIMAVAWTVTLGDYQDQPNSFTLSHDGGRSWGPIRSTGLNGQTMTPIPLGDDRLLVLYNRRYGQQGIVAALVTFTETDWTCHDETLLYDARSQRERPQDRQTGVDELESFQFGYPTAIPLDDGAFLTTHWCVEAGVCGIRWTRLRIDW